MLATIPDELTCAIEELRGEVAALSERLSKLEHPAPAAAASTINAAPVAMPTPAAAPVVAAAPEISEEEMLAISAALAAYFGVRVHMRQIRLISSRAWAQEGRVSVQASHRLHR